MTAAAVAIAAAAAAAAATSFAGSATVAALGPRFTGVGVLLPTAFLGLAVLAAAGLEPGVLEGVGLLSCVLGRLGVFVSEALVVVGFFVVTSDFAANFGVSNFADFVIDEGRVSGESVGFLAAGVADLVTSRGNRAQGMVKRVLKCYNETRHFIITQKTHYLSFL